MRNDRCEAVRDLLPESVAGLLDASATSDVAAHLAACGDCTAERDIVLAVRTHAPAPPAALEQRIVRELATWRPAYRRRSRARSVAIAAAAAFAVITGGLLVRSLSDAGAGPRDEVAASVTPAWPAVQDRLLRVTPVLHDLSVEELESLLAELES